MSARPRRTGLLRLAFLGGSAALAACAPVYVGPPPGNLQGMRQACNRDYPRRIGNYLPHAQCVNAAVEAYAVPSARYPDLLRLQEQLRTVFSEKIDRRVITPQTGERRMGHADALIAEIERDRNLGRDASAERRAAMLDRMLAE